MRFRPDVEGLRALAIVPVIVFHAWPGLLPGGFAGVDIFFVISGFLITSLLLQQLAEGRYSIAYFYAARIRRIFPALFAMLLGVAPVAVALLTPAALDEFARLMGAATLFVSNLELRRTTGYFEGAAELKFLVHTWSLAVEEQYYIFFPLILAALWKWWRRGIGLGLCLMGALSLVYCLRLMPHDPVLAFYAAPARAFELMVGSVLAWQLDKRRGETLADSTTARVIGTAGGAGLVLSAFMLAPEQNFPGPAALLPCLSTAALIWSGAREGTWSARLLGAAPLRWIGAHSFSLYLWHWPVLVATRHLVLDKPEAWLMALAVLVSLGLSMASLRWVETPMRRSQFGVRSLLRGGCIALLAGVGIALAVGLWAHFRPMHSESERVLLQGAEDFSPDRAKCHVHAHVTMDYDRRCVFGNLQAAKEFAVWGDSHGVELARALGNQLGVDGPWRVSELSSSSCPPALGFPAPGRSGCMADNEMVLTRLEADQNVRTVLIAARYELYLAGPAAQAFEAGLRLSVERLRRAGKQVLLLEPVPTYRYPVPAALAQRQWRGEDLSAQGQLLVDYGKLQHASLQALRAIARSTGAGLVPTGAWLCAPLRCKVQDSQGHPLYFDDNHLSMHGAALVAPAVIEQLQ